ncbi:MAG: DUF4129 domain-containing protein [Chloroflexaceae bacterium]|nr:DUF4129 domain-containing protein [Chloroflexaceae bacterium]
MHHYFCRQLQLLRPICALLMILVLTGWFGPVQAQENPTPDLATYEVWVRAALAAAQRNDRIGLEREAAPPLINARAVLVGNDMSVPVDNSWLAVALDEPEPDLVQIANRLQAALDALARPSHTLPTQAHEQLDTLLRQPPFAQEERQETLFDQFVNWLLRQLEQFFGEGNDATSGLPGQIMLLFMGVLIAGVVIYLLLGLRRTMVSEAQVRDTDDPEARLTANTALQQASELARGGDYRTAVRYLYLSSLLWLDERDMLRYERNLTNYEYLDRLHEQPELRTCLMPIVETFDRVWYGLDPLDADGFARYRQQVEALRRIRPSRS